MWRTVPRKRSGMAAVDRLGDYYGNLRSDLIAAARLPGAQNITPERERRRRGFFRRETRLDDRQKVVGEPAPTEAARR